MKGADRFMIGDRVRYTPGRWSGEKPRDATVAGFSGRRVQILMPTVTGRYQVRRTVNPESLTLLPGGGLRVS